MNGTKISTNYGTVCKIFPLTENSFSDPGGNPHTQSITKST